MAISPRRTELAGSLLHPGPPETEFKFEFSKDFFMDHLLCETIGEHRNN